MNQQTKQILNNGQTLSRGVEKSIKKWLKCGLKIKKMSLSSKEIILIGIDGSDKFLIAYEIGKRSEARSLRN